MFSFASVTHCCHPSFSLHRIPSASEVDFGMNLANLVLICHLLSFLQSQFVEKGFKKTVNLEHSVVYCCFYLL